MLDFLLETTLLHLLETKINCIDKRQYLLAVTASPHNKSQMDTNLQTLICLSRKRQKKQNSFSGHKCNHLRSMDWVRFISQKKICLTKEGAVEAEKWQIKTFLNGSGCPLHTGIFRKMSQQWLMAGSDETLCVSASQIREVQCSSVPVRVN